MYTPPSARVSAAYRQVDLSSQVMSASPHGLIGLLFKELRSCLVGAKGAMERKDVAAKVRLIGKAARLLDEGLLAGLDVKAGGELAANLHRVYSYCLARLLVANAHNDAAIVDEVLQVLQPVMDGWNEIGGRASA
ncbi:flagellar export chaperone FliS [Diaphorobacter sp. MNS-0]|uniref:flagellar export chaperone FliS n=1 Tax=Diaphorobacter sp. MNS-0 TaxID=2866628 RepID=UPI001C72B9B0|nr:flagellar export chaperone FliS [Diaphorobacter sp. MNS-0]QYY25288.1 flagellar export chaperone FliS [Diaphorobacter sp. MNS-0]